MTSEDRGKAGDGVMPKSVSAATSNAQSAVQRPRSGTRLLLLAICAGIAFSGFFALGTWQLFRLKWKLDLIERVDQRVHAQPVAAPGPDRWPQVTAQTDEYRHVRVTGVFLYELTARVQAVTDLGNGFWLLTPLRAADGSIVLINRGFIPASQASRALEFRGDALNAAGLADVTGLLRISEPRGGFLRHNDPAADRWYSRDVQAIAASRRLANVAPYFVDADAPATGRKFAQGKTDTPVAGLTVIAFHNNHLVYALTWYALALMAAGAGFWIVRDERNLRRRSIGNSADGIDRESEDGESK
jgi:surfeit locus 1 family protein